MTEIILKKIPKEQLTKAEREFATIENIELETHVVCDAKTGEPILTKVEDK